MTAHHHPDRLYMNRRRIAFIVLPVVLGVAVSGAVVPEGSLNMNPGAAIPSPSLSSYQHSPSPSVSAWAQADTVEAGRVFIVQLPDSLSERAIETYSADRLPLKSWLLEKSFLWATTTDDRGVHAFTFQGHPQPPQESPEDLPTLETIDWTMTVFVQ